MPAGCRGASARGGGLVQDAGSGAGPIGWDRSRQCRTWRGGHDMTGNSFGSRATLTAGQTSYEIHRLDAVDGAADLPFSLKVLLENLLRTEDGVNVTADHVTALAQW